jgi:hypothetical protein
LSRVFCQFGHLLPDETVEGLRQEVTTYPGFLTGGTENHVAMRRTAGLLFGQWMPDAAYHYGLTGAELVRGYRVEVGDRLG